MFFNLINILLRRKTMTQFIQVTRVYKLKGTKVDATTGKAPLKSQPFTVALDAIEGVRPSNRLGYPEHRATITMKSGAFIDVAEKYSVVRKAMGIKA